MKIMLVSLFDVTPVDETRPMRYLSMANVFIENGCSVEYLSNTFRHATKKNRVSSSQIITSPNGLRTTYLKSASYRSNTSAKRFVSHLVFAFYLRKYVNSLSSSELPDVIVSAMPPLIVNLVLQKWSKGKGIKFILDVIDPWPDVLKKFIPQWLHIFLFPYSLMTKKIVSEASGITSISNEYINWAKSYHSNSAYLKSHVAYPSIDLKTYQDLLEKNNHIDIRKSSETLNIVYAGNFGKSYDLPCILAAAEWFNNNYPGKTRFLLAGLGFYETLVKEYAVRCQNIEYFGRVGYEQLLELYSNSHLGLAQYRHEATQTFTYKFFDYLGAGLPLLNSLKSETWGLIENEGLGFNNSPGDYLGLAKNIEKFFDKKLLESYSNKSLHYTEVHGNSTVVYAGYLSFIHTLEN